MQIQFSYFCFLAGCRIFYLVETKLINVDNDTGVKVFKFPNLISFARVLVKFNANRYWCHRGTQIAKGKSNWSEYLLSIFYFNTFEIEQLQKKDQYFSKIAKTEENCTAVVCKSVQKLTAKSK